ncbi:hypothetical protein, partial [Bacillus gaemokensis]
FNKDDFFLSLNLLGQNMYAIRMILMIDDLNHGYTDPVYHLPLVKQRHHGVFPYHPQQTYAWRLIHNYVHGNYVPGRHRSSYKHIVYNYPVFILKFYYSPWNDSMRKRKLQIGPTLSPYSIQSGMGLHHLTSSIQLDETFLQLSKATQDLRLIPEYQVLLSHL